MRFLVLSLLLALSVFGQITSVSTGFGNYAECTADSDCNVDGNLTNICETYCVVNGDYALNTIRAIPSSDGSYNGLFYMADSNGVVRTFNESRLVQPDEFEGNYVFTSNVNGLVAYDVTVLIDVSASLYNYSDTVLTDYVSTIGSALFNDDESSVEYLSVYAFAGMEDPISVVRYATSADVASSEASKFQISQVSDQATNLFGSVFEVVERVRLNADDAPSEFADYQYIAQLVIIVSDGFDTAGRVGQATATASVNSFGASGDVYAFPTFGVDQDFDATVLNALSTEVMDYDVLANYSNVNGVRSAATAAVNIFRQKYTNAGTVSSCPESRDTTGSISVTDEDGGSITFSNLLFLDQPECANVFGGSVTRVYDIASSMKIQCLDVSSGVYYACGMYEGVYCGSCGADNPMFQFSSSIGATYISLATNSESVSLSFASSGKTDIGVQTYAREGALPDQSTYTFYAPESELFKTEDECESCGLQTVYDYAVGCPSSVTIDVTGIKPTDQWFVLAQGCGEPQGVEDVDVYDSDNTVDPFVPTIVQENADDDFLVSSTVSSGGLGAGAISGITVGAVAGAAILGIGCFCCIKKMKKPATS